MKKIKNLTRFVNFVGIYGKAVFDRDQLMVNGKLLPEVSADNNYD